MTQQQQDNCTKLVKDLKARIPTMKWSTWFSPIQFEVEGKVLKIISPSSFHSQWVSENYHSLLEEVVVQHLGQQASIEYPVNAVDTTDEILNEPDPIASTSQTTAPINGVSKKHNGLSSKYVFENFVVGSSNRLALAAALGVSEQPGSRYNPLFIYGPAGLGKTHLLYAVSHQTKRMRPSARIRYTTSEGFVNEFIDCIRHKRMDEFKQRYRTIDLLLLDDVQFFEGKEQVLEELFHTFNTLQGDSKQMVLTCDRPPRELQTIEDRLRSRFSSGLMADIKPPDIETRLAILRSKSEASQVEIPNEVLAFIAENFTCNIRELEGALNRLSAHNRLENGSITLDTAMTALQELLPVSPTRAATGPEIISHTATTHGFTVLDLEGPSRKQEVMRARQVAMYLCREIPGLSYPKIGRLFGGRDHTTVMHACQKIHKLLLTDQNLVDTINTLSRALSTNIP